MFYLYDITVTATPSMFEIYKQKNQAHKSPRKQVPDTLMSPTPTCPRHPHVPLTHMSPTPTGPPAHMSPTPTCPQHPHVPNTHMSPTPSCPPHPHVPNTHLSPTHSFGNYFFEFVYLFCSMREFEKSFFDSIVLHTT